ncbi:APC family permease [Streptomyces sp. DSM 40750]|uniref:APC family permease n=1 Tax=Streptomyces sp. DSM 40750 TaxID=2801030 RepID=UPI00214B059A|nr:APC family permease [Streptomyces sp. DSM 40750]UUU19127.1 APC family permease [Streptomyces sp. DSM 40750]UUU27529.1 APC family permease [Streptomyces sp. DSM 40750]
MDEPRHLQGNMGVGELAMSVLAFSAPLTTVAGFIPVLLMFGGKTGPAIYIVATVILLVFCVGFTVMGRAVPNPGGFYSFVTQGLGRPAGLGGAFLATFGYFMIGFFAPSFFAITVQSYVEKNLNGPHIAWGWYALAIVAVTTALAYRRIDLSAKVLTVVMVLEVVAVLVFDVASFVHGAPSGTGGATLSLPWLTDPNIGLALLFVVGNFFGFEATVIFREEVKDPDKTIPRATYLSVAGIGVFYALAAWAYIAFTGADKTQATATANTGGMFTDALTVLVGKTVVDIVTVLLLTSILASMLSIHNVTARYMYSLGTDGVVPTVLGKVHPKHGSPYAAASVIGGLWAIGVVLFVALGSDPNVLYARASGIGSFAILLLLFAASVAVFVYFRRNPSREPVWKTAVAPLVAAIGIGVVACLAVANYSDLLGGSGFVTSFFLIFTFALFLIGMAVARVLRTRRPEVYQRIGRQEL